MKKHRLLIIGGMSILGALPLLAHHAFAAEYDAKQFITVKGHSRRSIGSIRMRGCTST